jgi:hypothetical protein
MLLKMIPTGLGMSIRTAFGATQVETAHGLRFTLYLAGQDSVTLETGEVFQNPRYAAIRGNKKNAIAAQLNVHPTSDDPDPRANKMQYFAAVKSDDYGSDSFIHFDVSAPASDYSLLLNNIRGGLFPSAITVGLRHDIYGNGSPVGFDWAPDGSMMIWRNAKPEAQRVDIESVEFHYRVFGPNHNDDDAPSPWTAKGSIDAASGAIVAKLADLEKAFVKGNGFIVTVIIVVCAVLYFGRH